MRTTELVKRILFSERSCGFPHTKSARQRANESFENNASGRHDDIVKLRLLTDCCRASFISSLGVIAGCAKDATSRNSSSVDSLVELLQFYHLPLRITHRRTRFFSLRECTRQTHDLLVPVYLSHTHTPHTRD